MAIAAPARPQVRALRRAVVPPTKPLAQQLKSLHVVSAQQGYYLVILNGDYAQKHFVRKDRTCACELGGGCPAVEAVSDYLKAGGQRAPDVPETQQIPADCPECGGQVKFEPRLCSPQRGAGWVCLNEAAQDPEPASKLHIPGAQHFWRAQWNSVRPYFQRRALAS